jgi:hypothetical protein
MKPDMVRPIIRTMCRRNIDQISFGVSAAVADGIRLMACGPGILFAAVVFCSTILLVSFIPVLSGVSLG